MLLLTLSACAPPISSSQEARIADVLSRVEPVVRDYCNYYRLAKRGDSNVRLSNDTSAAAGHPSDLRVDAGDSALSTGQLPISAGAGQRDFIVGAGPSLDRNDSVLSGDAGDILASLHDPVFHRRADVQAAEGCSYAVRAVGSSYVYASTNGKAITITEEMARFASDDSELAFVLAHEFGHNLLHHSAGTFLGTNTKQLELQADYVGIYIVARAGYSAEIASHFLPKLASAFPNLRNADPTYPTLEERYRSLQQIIRELAGKMAIHEPLYPKLSDFPGSS